MHTRNILRQSPRHGDGKVLGPSFSESGAWATVLHPMKYKIPEAKGKANNAPSPTVDTAGGDSDQGDAAPFSPLVSNPKELEEVLKEVRALVVVWWFLSTHAHTHAAGKL